jgi:hypothetical protein
MRFAIVAIVAAHTQYCHLQDKHRLFAVRDNGIGVDPEYSEEIVGIFKRIHSAANILAPAWILRFANILSNGRPGFHIDAVPFAVARR